ncbi:MAG: D-tyrosyl-tRNA(Tyr) deacylase [Neisseriaceae bacterium]|nr:MAG: D-tyrosyl-tRNA(Tyr) deacylase [Neisseriaceae bacterium]
MRVVVQRVSSAQVVVDNRVVGKISHGLMLLIGITHNDTPETISWMAQKISKLRIFNDENDKMNLSIKDTGGEILAVSQFTLYGEAEKSNRPSFTTAAKPELANALYEQFKQELTKLDIKVEAGIFGADMQVALTNDGPVTIILEK